AEFAILFIFEGLVLHKMHFAAFPAASFSHSQFTSGPVGIAMLFAFTSFIGFESAALYGEETKDPQRSIPRATYIAVSSIGIFYILSTWIIVGSVGVDNVRALSKKDGGLFVLNLVQKYGGTILYDLTAVLLCTSVLAGYSAIHNAASRYLFALGRESIMPNRFGQHHKRYFSPHIASLAITGVAAVSLVGFAVSGADPYTVYAASLIAVGTLGIVALQAMASLSVVSFFWRRPDRKMWQGVIAPIIGFIGLVIAFVLAAMHYNTLTGSSNKVVNLVPFLLLVIAVGGVIYGHRLRKSRPDVYADLATSQLREEI
ncbi:MAG TPA: APC family permease, partial [Candidatus Nanopelagicaceae bacterium]